MSIGLCAWIIDPAISEVRRLEAPGLDTGSYGLTQVISETNVGEIY
jgi:hypothetical protein